MGQGSSTRLFIVKKPKLVRVKMFKGLVTCWVAKDMQESWVSHNFYTYETPPKSKFFKHFGNFKSDLPSEDDTIEKV